jgi:hypothetical protein
MGPRAARRSLWLHRPLRACRAHQTAPTDAGGDDRIARVPATFVAVTARNARADRRTANGAARPARGLFASARNLVTGCLGTAPEWMGPVTNDERLAMNDRVLLDQLSPCLNCGPIPPLTPAS